MPTSMLSVAQHVFVCLEQAIAGEKSNTLSLSKSYCVSAVFISLVIMILWPLWWPPSADSTSTFDNTRNIEFNNS